MQNLPSETNSNLQFNEYISVLKSVHTEGSMIRFEKNLNDKLFYK